MKPKPGPASKSAFTEGLDGIFRGLGALLETAAQMADITQEDIELGRTGSQEKKGFRAVYGVSVRVGPNGMPTVEKFGNLRRRPGQKPIVEEFREPMTDLLDEGDYFLVLAELPGMDESAVQWRINGNTVIISAESGDRKFRKELLLPSAIDAKKVLANYKNGILELRLCKQDAR